MEAGTGAGGTAGGEGPGPGVPAGAANHTHVLMDRFGVGWGAIKPHHVVSAGKSRRERQPHIPQTHNTNFFLIFFNFYCNM